MHSYRFGIEEEYLGGYPNGLVGLSDCRERRTSAHRLS